MNNLVELKQKIGQIMKTKSYTSNWAYYADVSYEIHTTYFEKKSYNIKIYNKSILLATLILSAILNVIWAPSQYKYHLSR